MKNWINTFGLWMACLGAAASAGSLQPTDLRCESLREPVGIEAWLPRLSWVLEAESPRARGLSQTAYRVLVASSRQHLDADQGDLWDSGKITSDQSIQLRYGGKLLTSLAECFWKVRVWDQDGHPSAWSHSARWTMGLLYATDWTGKWIGRDEADQKKFLSDTQWIWFPEGRPEKDAPVGRACFAAHLLCRRIAR